MCAALALMCAALTQMVRVLALICAGFAHKIDAVALMCAVSAHVFGVLALMCAALAHMALMCARSIHLRRPQYSATLLVSSPIAIRNATYGSLSISDFQYAAPYPASPFPRAAVAGWRRRIDIGPRLSVAVEARFAVVVFLSVTCSLRSRGAKGIVVFAR